MKLWRTFLAPFFFVLFRNCLKSNKFVCIYTTLPPQARCDIKSFFKQTKAGLIRIFFLTNKFQMFYNVLLFPYTIYTWVSSDTIQDICWPLQPEIVGISVGLDLALVNYLCIKFICMVWLPKFRLKFRS